MPDLKDLIASRDADKGKFQMPQNVGIARGNQWRPVDANPISQEVDTQSRFDEGRFIEQNINDFRSENQGAWWEAGATVGRIAGQGIAKTAQGFSMLGSAVGAAVAGTADALAIDNLFGVEMDDKH
jgi:hypothetical protein